MLGLARLSVQGALRTASASDQIKNLSQRILRAIQHFAINQIRISQCSNFVQNRRMLRCACKTLSVGQRGNLVAERLTKPFSLKRFAGSDLFLGASCKFVEVPLLECRTFFVQYTCKVVCPLLE